VRCYLETASQQARSVQVLPEAIVKLCSEVSTIPSAALEQLAFQQSMFRNVLADARYPDDMIR
jgi:hypothetical protein